MGRRSHACQHGTYGDARTSGERRKKEGGNIFDDQIRVGVAIWFCVKKEGTKGCKIYYESVRDYAKSEEKLNFVSNKPLRVRLFDVINPDAKNNWVNLADNDFDQHMALANKETKSAKSTASENAIFKAYSLGVVTARDQWVYDVDAGNLGKKIQHLISAYNIDRVKLLNDHGNEDLSSMLDNSIKWSRAVKNDFRRNLNYEYLHSTIFVE